MGKAPYLFSAISDRDSEGDRDSNAQYSAKRDFRLVEIHVTGANIAIVKAKSK